jgi:signal transduction histidine kinase
VDLAAAAAPVIADAGGLEQVAYNLVRNAVQASPTGGRVWVTVEPGSLCVEDEGLGVEPAHRAWLFEPFFTTKPAGEGTGLGLAIAHGIVSEHGGSIAVESREPTGARFVVRLPPAELG